MLAVVQIGSSTVRSPCITARIVLAAGGADWAVSRPGAATAAVAARPVLRKLRREVVARRVMGVLLGLGRSAGRPTVILVTWPAAPTPARFTHACVTWARGCRRDVGEPRRDLLMATAAPLMACSGTPLMAKRSGTPRICGSRRAWRGPRMGAGSLSLLLALHYH